MTKNELLKVLSKNKYIKSHAARELGVDEATVRRMCIRHNIDVEYEKLKAIAETKIEVFKVANSSSKKKKEIGRFVVIPDLHSTHHSRRSFNAVLKFIEDFAPETVVQIGDLLDLYVLMEKVKQKTPSFSEADVKELERDFEIGAELLSDISSVCPEGCEKVWTLGNHEYRIDMLLERFPHFKELLAIESRMNVGDWKILPYLTPHKIAKLNVFHGEFWNVAHLRKHLQVYQKNVLYGHCFDEATEILTDKGWKKGLDLTGSEKVMTMNKGTFQLELQKINKVYSYDDFNSLVKIKGKNVDLAVTDCHGLIEFNKKRNRIKEYKAKDYVDKKERTFKCAGQATRKGLALSDDLIKFIVWVAADGSRENKDLIRFHLKKERKVKRLVALLNRLGTKYSHNTGSNGTTRINVSLKDTVLKEIKQMELKPLPKCLVEANRKQALIILEEYGHTDGHKYSESSYQISTAKEEEADLLQEIFVTNNIKCNKIKRPFGWVLCVNKRSSFIRLHTTTSHKEVSYKGVVWCVSVHNGTLMVRRNGKVSITQNTHAIGQDTLQSPLRTLPTWAGNVGCLCDLSPDYQRNKSNKWEHGFCYGYFDKKTGDFWPTLCRVLNHRFIAEGKEYKG